jgi:methionine--tRNA ligase beta chain
VANEVARLDLRVGKIVSIEKHPDAESLYVEKIDVGEAEPRTIVSGLVSYYEASQLLGRSCIVLCNLKPSKLRGIMSQGMVLAASVGSKSTEDLTVKPQVQILDAPAGAKIGERVQVAGYTDQKVNEPDASINPKQKYYGEIMGALQTDEQCVATYKSTALMTSAGPVRTLSLSEARIS